MIVRDILISDCLELSKIRYKENDFGFLHNLGYLFYSEILKGTCESKWGFGKVCIDNNNIIIGFIIATTNLKRYYSDIVLKRGFKLFFYSMVPLLKNTFLIKGIIDFLTYPKISSNDSITSEWLTMVVEKKYRSKGIGKMLTLALISEYRKRGVVQFKSTVMKSNTISCRLHKKFGFHLLREINFNGKCMNIYRYEIKN